LLELQLSWKTLYLEKETIHPYYYMTTKILLLYKSQAADS